MNDNKVLRIFRCLAAKNSRLAPVPSIQGENCGSGSFAVITENRQSAKTLVVAPYAIRQWLSEDLIERCGDGYRLSPAGRNWLKRRLSANGDFQAQHQARQVRIIDIEGVKSRAVVNDAESPLRWLASRRDKKGAKLLDAIQIEAGERLRADYQFAGLSARVTASWSPAAHCNSSCGSQSDAAAIQDHVLAARQRVVRAVAAVGPELSGILVDVCCHLKGLEEAEKMEGWPRRSGKVILQMALTRLARHYGLISGDRLGDGVRRKLQHWGAEDYRPKITDYGAVS